MAIPLATAASLGSGLGTFAGGLFGHKAANRNAARARASLQQGLDYMDDTDVQSADAWANQTEDPTGREAQMRALSGLEGVYSARGMDAGAKAAFGQARDQTAQYERGQREAIVSNAQQRGAGGSGQALAAQLGGMQTSTNALGQAGAKFAGDARQRALYALGEAGQLGGNIRGGDASFQGNKANAANAIGQFNAQQRWAKAQGMNAGYQGMANAWDRNGQRQQQFYTGLGNTVGDLAGTAGGMAWNKWGAK